MSFDIQILYSLPPVIQLMTFLCDHEGVEVILGAFDRVFLLERRRSVSISVTLTISTVRKHLELYQLAHIIALGVLDHIDRLVLSSQLIKLFMLSDIHTGLGLR